MIEDKNNTIAVEKIKIISSITWIGLIIAIIFHFIFNANKGYPFDTFLFLPTDRFNDFYGPSEAPSINNFNPYFHQSYSDNGLYLPIGYYFIWIFSIFGRPLSLFMFLSLLTYLTYKLSFLSLPELPTKLKIKTVFLISLLSYGFIYAIDRANVEPYLACCIFAFFYFYKKNNLHLSALFIAVAAAAKIYPILFILIFISDKKYKESLYTIIYMVLLVLLPLFVLKGGFINNLNYILTGFEPLESSIINGNVYDGTSSFMQQGISLFSGIKFLNIKLGLNIINLFFYYKIIVLIITITISSIVLLLENELWKKAFLLTAIILILPHISFDYKLTLLLPCIYLYISADNINSNNIKKTKKISFLFGILLIPKAYYYLENFISPGTYKYDVPVSTIITPIIILYLIFIISKDSFKNITSVKLINSLKLHYEAIKYNSKVILVFFLILFPLFIQFYKANSQYSLYRSYIDNAQKQLQLNKPDSVINNLQLARKLKPYKFKLPLQIADIYYKKEIWDSAALYFNSTLNLFPECGEAKIGLIQSKGNRLIKSAVFYFNNKDYVNASLHFSEAIKTFYTLPIYAQDKNSFITLYSNLILCKIKIQDWEQALININRLKTLDPKNEFATTKLLFVNDKLKENKTHL